MKEIWKEFVREDLKNTYFVSNLGRVKRSNGEILDSGYKNMGYPAFVTKNKKGKNAMIYIHKVVAKLFVPNPDHYKHIKFIDGTKNPTADNLKWIGGEELRESMRQRRTPYEVHPNLKPNCKLTEANVAIIKRLLIEGKTRKSIIAKQFKVNVTSIYAIQKGTRWAHVKPAKAKK